MPTTATLATLSDSALTADPNWWRQAAVYQIYPRSFADSNGDGLGDIKGITAKVPYLKTLGIDAVWLSPFYPSALADGGYDVDDYRNVDPKLGTLADFDEMAKALHGAGIKLIADIVPNHSSNRHEWFTGGARLAEGLTRPGPLHLPRRQGRERRPAAVGLGLRVRRPRLGAHHRTGRHPRPVVPAHLREGAAGPELGQPRGPRRLPEDPALLVRPRRGRLPCRRGPRPDQGPHRTAALQAGTERRQHRRDGFDDGTHPFWDRDEVHEIYAEWREVFNEYNPPRTAVAEAWVHATRRARYASPEGLGQAFNFDLLQADFDADEVPRDHHPQPGRGRADRGVLHLGVLQPRRGPARHPLRPARGARTAKERAKGQDGKDWLLAGGPKDELDVELGRAPCPGRDPADAGGAGIGVPVPGRGAGPAGSGGHPGRRTPGPGLLPQQGRGDGPRRLPGAAAWKVGGPPSASATAARTCRSRTGSASTPSRRRTAPRLHPGAVPQGPEAAPRAAGGARNWTGSNGNPEVLHFRRPGGWQSVTNFGDTAVELPAGEVLVSSAPLEDGKLPGDTTAWLR